MPVGDALIGRVVNALGQPIDGKGPIETKEFRRIEVKAPGIVERQPVKEPLQTGHQGHRLHDPDRPRPARADHRRPPDRQDRRSPSTPSSTRRGRTSSASTSPSARSAPRSRRSWRRCSKYGAMEYTIVVAATAAEPAPLQYIAPYAGCTMGEYFRDNGKHALVVYDDLSKHAVAYRQLSLLLRRPPGREAYPGRRLLPPLAAPGARGQALGTTRAAGR